MRADSFHAHVFPTNVCAFASLALCVLRRAVLHVRRSRAVCARLFPRRLRPLPVCAAVRSLLFVLSTLLFLSLCVAL